MTVDGSTPREGIRVEGDPTETKPETPDERLERITASEADYVARVLRGEHALAVLMGEAPAQPGDDCYADIHAVFAELRTLQEEKEKLRLENLAIDHAGAKLAAECHELQGENERNRGKVEALESMRLHDHETITNLRAALDDARGLVEKWREQANKADEQSGSMWYVGTKRTAADELEAALQSSPMNEEPKE